MSYRNRLISMSGLPFYSMLSRYYDNLFPATPAEVAFIAQELHRVGAKRILDVGCGTGAHCRALSALGFHTVGIDIDEKMIAIAASRALRNSRGSVSLLVGGFADIERLPAMGQELGFDAILCIGNTLAHLDGLEEVYTALRQMRAALRQPTDDRPETTIVLQVVNFERVLRLKSVQLPDIRLPDVAFFRTYSLLRSGKVEFFGRLEEKEAGSPPTSQSSTLLLTPVTANDLTTGLRSLGAHEIRVYGSFNRDPFDPLTSIQAVLTARVGI